MSGPDYLYKFRQWLSSGRMPLTKGLILSNAVTFLLIYLAHLKAINEFLVFSPWYVLSEPWILFTHPIVGAYGPGPNGLIALLFAGYWLWFAGGSLERTWSTRRFAAFFFTMSAVSALGLLAGHLITGEGAETAGLWLPLAGVTVAFAMLNPEQQILFFFIIPMKLKYLALLGAAIVLVSYGTTNPVLGVTALAGCAYSYWYVRRPKLGDRGGRRRERPPVIRVRRRSLFSRLNPLARLRDRRERDRLRDFFDKSGME